MRRSIAMSSIVLLVSCCSLPAVEGAIVTWRIDYDYTKSPLSPLKKPLFNKAIPDGLDGLVELHGGTRVATNEEPPN